MPAKKNEISLPIPEELRDPRLLLKRTIALEIWGVVVLTLTIVYFLALIDYGGTVGEKLVWILRPLGGKAGSWMIAGLLLLSTFHLLSAAKFSITGRLVRLYTMSIPLILGAYESSMHMQSFYWDVEAIKTTGYVGLWIGRGMRLLVGDSAVIVSAVLIVTLAFVFLQLNPLVLLKALGEVTVIGLKKLWNTDRKIEKTQLPPANLESVLFNHEAEEEEFPEPEPEIIEPEPVKINSYQPPPGSQLDLGLDEVHALPKPMHYKLPSPELLEPAAPPVVDDDYREFAAQRIVKTLDTFGIPCQVSDVITGPAVTRVEVVLGEGIRVNKVEGMEKDIAYILPAKRVRVEAPIPGKTAIGIEFPNIRTNLVRMKELVSLPEWKKARAPLTMAVAKNLNNQPVLANLGKMPHLLVAGQTGSGKSVCLHSIIISLIYRLTPEQLRLILIDPKMVEFGFYEGLPHLLTPVVNDVNDAVNALRWSVQEMRDRYKKLKVAGARDISSFNHKKNSDDRMPYIVIVIDEMADLMAQEGFEIEACITSLTQLARAVGIHLVLATQRPSVKIITGNIKGNIPARIALNVASYNDSRTILDHKGAETLLGNGDMLFKPVDEDNPTRAQGVLVEDDEIRRVVEFWSKQGKADYDDEVTAEHAPTKPTKASVGVGEPTDINSMDTKMVRDAITVFMNEGEASTSNLQSKLGLGYPRARRLMDQMEELGLIGQKNGSKPRDINFSACRKMIIQIEGTSAADDFPLPMDNNVDEILSEV